MNSFINLFKAFSHRRTGTFFSNGLLYVPFGSCMRSNISLVSGDVFAAYILEVGECEFAGVWKVGMKVFG